MVAPYCIWSMALWMTVATSGRKSHLCSHLGLHSWRTIKKSCSSWWSQLLSASCKLPFTTAALRYLHLVPALVAWVHLSASLIHLSPHSTSYQDTRAQEVWDLDSSMDVPTNVKGRVLVVAKYRAWDLKCEGRNEQNATWVFFRKSCEIFLQHSPLDVLSG